jgi:SNF2 family DNA or RNA helicase
MSQALADTKADIRERRARIEAVFQRRAAGKPWMEGIFDHQWRGACYGAVAKRWILGDEPGLGKTRTITGWADLIGAQRVVLFAEANVCSQFAGEIEELAPHRRVIAVNGLDRGTRHSALDDLPFVREAVVVVNFEMFRVDRHALAKLTRWRADTVIVDEAHNLKATKTGNFKDVQTVVFYDNTCRQCGAAIEGLYDEQYWEDYGRKKAKPCPSCGWRKPAPKDDVELGEYPHRLAKVLSTKSVKNLALLTGTPILNNPGDLYALVHLVDPVTWPQFDGQGGFKERYLEQNYFTNRWEWQAGALETLKAELKGRFLQRKKADVFTWDEERRGWILPNGGFLPEQKIQVIDVTLDRERYPLQYRTIRQITERAMIELSTGEQHNIMAIIAVMTRKRQANVWPAGIEIRDKEGNVLFSVGSEVQESAKMDAVVDNVAHLWQQGKRQVVFSQFTTALAELERRLVRKGLRVARLDGSVTKKQRETVKQDFYLAKTPGRGRYDVVLAQYKSGGTGLNLTAATETHILDEEWNPGKRNQSYHRTFRIGQDSTTRVWVYRLRGTIDQWLANLLQQKEEMIEAFEGSVTITKSEMKNSLLEGMQNGSIL